MKLVIMKWLGSLQYTIFKVNFQNTVTIRIPDIRNIDACQPFNLAKLSLYVFWGLATLLEGAGLAFDIQKCSKFNYGCFKAVKLVKNVIIVINGVPTIYLWKKNEEKRGVLL